MTTVSNTPAAAPPPPPRPRSEEQLRAKAAEETGGAPEAKGSKGTAEAERAQAPQKQAATEQVQRASRQQATAAEQQQKQNLLQTNVAPTGQGPARGIPKASTAEGAEAKGTAPSSDAPPAQDPKTQPIMVLAPQFGDSKSDEIVKASYERVKANAEANGFNVIDAPNMSGDALKEKVASQVPKGHTGPVVAWTGGHGDVVQDKGEKNTEHEIVAGNKDGTKSKTRTGEDILRPIFDGAKEKSGADPKMTAFVGSCRSGEAANDLAETFSKEEQENLAVVASSGRDQLSNGDGMKGVEAATMAFTDMMASDSKTRTKADANADGEVSAAEFRDHVNTDGGGLAVPRENDLDGDQRPDVINIDSQKIEVAGNGANPLVPKDTGAPGWKESAAPGEDAPRPMTRAQAMEQAKEIQGYLKGLYGQAPKIVDNPTTASGISAQVDANGRDIAAGPTTVRENTDKSRHISSPASETNLGYDEKVAPGGRKSEFAYKDQKGNLVESGTSTYDAQGRPLTRKSTFPEQSHMQSLETTSQYDDKSKPTSTTTARYKNGTTVTTFNMNDADNQGPWHQNAVASQTQVHGADGKMWEMTTNFNRPDGDKPYVMQDQQFMNLETGRPNFSVQQMSTGEQQYRGANGEQMDEAAARKANPWFFQKQ